MIDDGYLVVDGHNKNLDHKAFKEPFPSYEKEESSNPKSNNKVKYTYSNNDDEIVHMVEPMGFEYYDVITIKGKQDHTKTLLRGPSPKTLDSKSSQSYANTVTCSCAKLVLKEPTPSALELEQNKEKPLVGLSGKGAQLVTFSATTSYNILDQLQQTNAQIMIFKLLKISLSHRKILDKALTEENVP